jgi:hypothetical protein
MAGGEDPLLPPDGNLVAPAFRRLSGGRPALRFSSSPKTLAGFAHLSDWRDAGAKKAKASPLSDEACLASNSYTLNDDPQPHVLFTFGFSNLNPAPSRVSM